MTILAIETATSDVAVGIADESGPLVHVSVRSGRRHAELLHPLVQQVCELAACTLSQLDAIAVDVGPGLFTGIRVGIGAAKGFATALGIPVVALSSLEILRAAGEACSLVPVVPVVDLRRGEVAWSLPSGAVDFGPPDRLIGIIDSIRGPLLLAGDGALRYASMLSGPTGRIKIAGDELAAPPVASLAVRAVAELHAGHAIDPLEVLPVYLRDADARINWTTRHDAAGLVGPDGAER